MNMSGKTKIWDKAVVFVIGLLTICVMVLFYRQATEYQGLYFSDLPNHIKFGQEGIGYSLADRIFGVLMRLPGGYLLIAATLTCCVVLNGYVGYLFLKLMLKRNKVEISAFVLWGCSFLLMFEASVYLYHIFPYFYMKSYSTQPWHNATYIFMRLFGTMALILYFHIEEHYLENISIKEWLGFAVCLTLVNAFKPNFIVVFAPMMLIMLVRDFVKLHGKRVMQMIKFGCAVLTSLLVLIFEAKVLYPKGGESGLEIGVQHFVEFLSSPVTLLQLLCSLSFPLLIAGIGLKKKENMYFLKCTWMMYIIGILEYKLIWETGPREKAGNMAWGFMFGAYAVFLASVAKLLAWTKNEKKCSGYLIASWTLLGLNILSGLMYFGVLLFGGYYAI